MNQNKLKIIETIDKSYYRVSIQVGSRAQEPIESLGSFKNQVES